VAAAADRSTLAFPDQTIGLPPLSLAEIAPPGPLGFLRDAGGWFRRRSPSPVPAKKFVSHMPVRAPRDDLDPQMARVPDSSTDYKLLVKAPEVESAK